MENENTTQEATVTVVQEPQIEDKPMFAKPTITAENQKDRVALLKKVHTLHKEMRKLDWTPDGLNTAWNHEYFTAGLIKSHFQKACIEAGLVFMLDIQDVETLAPTRGFSVRMGMKAYLTLIDIDTGASLFYTTIGEAGDSGDKCSAKLVTMTIKSAIATNFAVADIDPEMDIADNFNREVKQEKAKNTLRANAQNKPTATVKTKTKATTPEKAPSPATGTETAEEPKLEADSTDDTREMTTVQKNTIKMIYSSISENAPEGFDLTLFKESADGILKDGNRGTAGEWITQYRGMMK